MKKWCGIGLALAVWGCDHGVAKEQGNTPPVAKSAVTNRPPLDAAEKITLPELDDRDQLLLAYHYRIVSGEPEKARELLLKLIADSNIRGRSRALAALQLAEMEELGGQRRRALEYLELAKTLAGPVYAMALEADDRRARILSVTPLADVRGPVPGSLALEGESAMVGNLFREAERRLAAYHRVVVAPSLENVNAVLRAKRRTLASAEAAYQKVIHSGGEVARVAAQFRIGAMYHHLAEALAFESPEELLPSEARRLTRKLRAESTGFLRRALVFYRSASDGPATVGVATWQKLARQEANTLVLVLEKKGRPHPKPP